MINELIYVLTWSDKMHTFHCKSCGVTDIYIFPKIAISNDK